MSKPYFRYDFSEVIEDLEEVEDTILLLFAKSEFFASVLHNKINVLSIEVHRDSQGSWPVVYFELVNENSLEFFENSNNCIEIQVDQYMEGVYDAIFNIELFEKAIEAIFNKRSNKLKLEFIYTMFTLYVIFLVSELSEDKEITLQDIIDYFMTLKQNILGGKEI